MRPGPVPLPTKLRLLRGKGTTNHEEPQPEEVKTLPPPPSLTGAALKKWHEMTEKLADLGMLTNLESDLLLVYCETWADWLDAKQKLRDFGQVIKAPSGYPMQSPFVNIESKARLHLVRMQSEMGLTPSGRSRVTGGRSRSAKQTRLEKFLDGRAKISLRARR